MAHPMPHRLARAEWLLLLLGWDAPAAPHPLHMDRARVMKSLFVMSKQLPGLSPPDFYDFRAYHYGPFDSAVYADADLLAGQGLVEEIPARYPSYAATPAGVLRAADLGSALPADTLDFVHRVRVWATSVDFNTLVRAIYQAWPEMRANSVWQG